MFLRGVSAGRRERKRGGQGGSRVQSVERGPGKKGEVLVRTRYDGAGERASGEGGAVELLGKLFGMFQGVKMPEEAPLMTFWKCTKWKVWTRGQATHCLRSGIAGVAEEWSQEGGEGKE